MPSPLQPGCYGHHGKGGVEERAYPTRCMPQRSPCQGRGSTSWTLDSIQAVCSCWRLVSATPFNHLRHASRVGNLGRGGEPVPHSLQTPGEEAANRPLAFNHSARVFASGQEVRIEAWIVRSLVYVASRAIKRGHRPKEPELRDLMSAVDIPIPTPSPRGVHANGASS